MDPNAALAEIRRLILEIQNAEQEDARLKAEAELIDYFEDLDAWLSKGGFLPTDWSR